MTYAIIDGMENIADIRYKNTRQLIELHCDPNRAIKDFAGRIGVQPGYASGMASPDPSKRSRPIGDSMARRIENAFDQERYWLDTPHWMEAYSVKNYGVAEGYVVHPKTAQKTLPVLTGATLQAFLNGDSSVTTKHWKSIDLAIPAKRMFILLEETSALSPMWQPGDVHYVDPDTPAEHGRLAVFVVNGRGMVGIFERGAAGDRLTFNNPREPVVDVTNATFAGSVMVTFKREFYDQITKS